MSINTRVSIREEEEGDSAHETEAALRKRAASNALDIRVNKRPRHEGLEVDSQSESDGPYGRPGGEALGEQERSERGAMLTEDDELYRSLEREVDDMIKYKASNHDPRHISDPGYDQFYGFTGADCQSTTVVEESKSYIICDSPQEALKYFKTHEKEVRRRIKHIIFSRKAVAVGPSLNGMHWKGLCNYIRKYMCIESIMIPVPYDPLSGHVRYKSSENDDLIEETIGHRTCPASDGATFSPPQLSPKESFVLKSRRFTFDWKILFYLSQALVSGFLKEIRLYYPAPFGNTMSPNFKAIRAINKHTQDYAKEKSKTALQARNVDPDCVRSQYAFNLSMQPFSNAYCALRLVSRQIQLEASPFLFKDKTLVIACNAKEAYQYLIRLPTDQLKHIKIIRLHELVLYSGDEGNRHAWPRLAEFIASQIPLQELVLHVPNDPNFYDSSADDDEATTSGDEEEEEDAEEVALRRIERCQTMLKDWIGYWWPGARLVMQLLLQKRIAKSIKLRHEAKDYLDRCGFPAEIKLHDLDAVDELGYAYDNKFDASFRYLMAQRMFDFFMQSTQLIGDEEWYEQWYEEDMMRHPYRRTFEFDTTAGTDDDGYQVVVITRKKEVEDVVLVQGQKRPGERLLHDE
ncbi:hypothetical protein EG328_000639 [Venturia inaequalis]|uniref:Uncharacterized protein n=1 Tax=Venturia inaequalis TaxID=5025 RepID=A0A8H3V2J4_VENIN|nr:hypothetical protein EG328_000639 [Venturia inaequalis]